jgi:hypothetical protein
LLWQRPNTGKEFRRVSQLRVCHHCEKGFADASLTQAKACGTFALTEGHAGAVMLPLIDKNAF